MKRIKEAAKYVLYFLIAIILFFAIVVAGFFGIMALGNEDAYAYSKASGWNYTDDEFIEVYYADSNAVIKELIEKHGLDCEFETSKTLSRYFWVYLWNDEYTIELFLANQDHNGWLSVDLYCFGGEEAAANFDSSNIPLGFVNELIETLTYFDGEFNNNAFKELHTLADAKEPGKKKAENVYHFDDYLGDLSFKVELGATGYEKYYKMQNNENAKRSADRYSYVGILKQLNNSEQ